MGRITQAETVNPEETDPYPGEIEEAKHIPGGWVYRIAGRFGPEDRIPPDAVMGAWKVSAEGRIVGDFVKNENYNPRRWPAELVPGYDDV